MCVGGEDGGEFGIWGGVGGFLASRGRVCMCVCLYVYVSLCVYVRLSVRVCLCVCAKMWIENADHDFFLFFPGAIFLDAGRGC